MASAGILSNPNSKSEVWRWPLQKHTPFKHYAKHRGKSNMWRRSIAVHTGKILTLLRNCNSIVSKTLRQLTMTKHAVHSMIKCNN